MTANQDFEAEMVTFKTKCANGLPIKIYPWYIGIHLLGVVDRCSLFKYGCGCVYIFRRAVLQKRAKSFEE